VRLADDLEPLVGGQDRGEGFGEEPMVVGNQYADLGWNGGAPGGEVFRILQDLRPKI
jgi:hypothetical protein